MASGVFRIHLAEQLAGTTDGGKPAAPVAFASHRGRGVQLNEAIKVVRNKSKIISKSRSQVIEGHAAKPRSRAHLSEELDRFVQIPFRVSGRADLISKTVGSALEEEGEISEGVGGPNGLCDFLLNGRQLLA
jgi:hypothetical protein